MTITPDITGFTDCLVLKIEELSDGELDTTLFILYDVNEKKFIVKGKRRDIFGKPLSVPYSFQCKCAEHLADFISFTICTKNKWSYSLYNYNDLPNHSDEITYEYLKDLDNDPSYEIAAYDNKNYCREYLVKSLKMLKNVFNYY
jgi:hypothetical protein